MEDDVSVSHSIIDNQSTMHRSLEVYALYSLPKVWMTLSTRTWTDELEDAYQAAMNPTTTRRRRTTRRTNRSSSSSSSLVLISQTGQQDSSVSHPLRSSTQTYLLDEFQTLIATWERSLPYDDTQQEEEDDETGVVVEEVDTSSSSFTSSTSYPFYNMYRHLVTIDVQIKLYVDMEETSHWDGTMTSTTTGSTATSTTTTTLKAELLPTLAFLEPNHYNASSSSSTSSQKPTNEQVRVLFGQEWMMNQLFPSSKYLQELNSPSHPEWMQAITKVQTEWLDGMLIMDNTNAPWNHHNNNDHTATINKTQSQYGGIQSALLTVMILLLLAGVAVFLFTLRRHRRKYRNLQLGALYEADLDLDTVGVGAVDRYQDEYASTGNNSVTNSHPRATSFPTRTTFSDVASNFSDRSYVSQTKTTTTPSSSSSLSRPPPLDTRASSLDAARHGVDVFHHRTSTFNAMTALEASDRYLSKHRPDWYSASQQQQQQQQHQQSLFNVLGRSYEIPSNPFEYYLGPYFSSQYNNNHHGSPSPVNTSPFPFSSPIPGSHADPVRRTSFSTTTPSPNNFSVIHTTMMNSSSAFTPVQNLAAVGSGHEDEPQLHAPPPPSSFYHNNLWSNNHHNATRSTTTTTPTSAHTGQSRWQPPLPPHDTRNNNSSTSSSIGNIFRNLSMSNWLSNTTTTTAKFGGNHHYHHQNDSRYYDDDDDEGAAIAVNNDLSYHHSNDPGLHVGNGDIELEALPLEEEDDDNPNDGTTSRHYDFAFRDFPRVDGTPCLIYNEDALKERERQRKAKEIFVIDDNEDDDDDHEEDHDNNNNVDYSSGTEKKEDDTRARMAARSRPVSDKVFLRMLSQNSLDVDKEHIAASGDYYDVLDGLATVDNTTPKNATSTTDQIRLAKSPQFQKQLSRLLETKQRRYAMEQKKEAIVQEHRKKRKHIREQQRLDRHKAMEKDLEDIEAEFLSPLTRHNHIDSMHMQQQQQQQQLPSQQQHPTPPLSPTRNPATSASAAASAAAAHSPNVTGNMATSSPASKHLRSPARQNIMFGGSVRHSHQRHNSSGGAMAVSPFRRFSGRYDANRSLGAGNALSSGSRHKANRSGNLIGLFRPPPAAAAATKGLTYPPPLAGAGSYQEFNNDDDDDDFDVKQDYKFKSDSMIGQDVVLKNHDDNHTDIGVDLYIPSMMDDAGKTKYQKYRSPQSVVDEATDLQSNSSGKHDPHQQQHVFAQRGTRSPSKASAASAAVPPLSMLPHRRHPSLEVLKNHSLDASASAAHSYYATIPLSHSPSKRMWSSSSHRRNASSSSPTSSSHQQQHRRSSSQHSLGGRQRRHRRSISQQATLGGASGGGDGITRYQHPAPCHHRRSNSSSQQPEDEIFLHGVVAAQTRFV